MNLFRQLSIFLFILVVNCQFSIGQFSVNIFPGAGSTNAKTMKRTPDGGYLAVGNTHYNWNSASVINQFDALVIKLNANFQFESQFIYSSDYQEGFDDVVSLPNGESVLLYSGGFSVRKGIIKIDANGSIIWIKKFDNNRSYSQLETNSNNELILVSSGPNEPGIVLTKMDTSGNVIWSKSYTTNSELLSPRLCKASNDEFFLTIHQYENNQSIPVVARLHDDGSLSNAIRIEQSITNDLSIKDIYQSNNLDVFVLGDYTDISGYRKQVLFKMTNTGNLLWTRELNFQHLYLQAHKIQGLSSSSVIVVGSLMDSVITNVLPLDGYALAYGSGGNLLWSKGYDGNEESFDHLFVNFDFIGVIGGLDHHSSAQRNMVTIKMDATGYIDCPYFNTTSLTPSFENNAYQISPITISVDPNIFTSPILASWGFTSTFQGTSVPNCESVGIESINDNANKLVFPNPSNGSFTISVPEDLINSKAFIYDVTGRQISELKLTQQNTKFKLPLEEGSYYIQIEKEMIKIIVH